MTEVQSGDALRIARAYLVEEAGSGSVWSSLGNAKAIAAIDAALSGTSAQAPPNLGVVNVENLSDWFYNEGHEFVVSDEEEVAKALLDQFDITPRKSLVRS